MRSKKNGHNDYQLAVAARPNAAPAQGNGRQDADFELKDRLKNLLIREEGRVVLPSGLHVAYLDSKSIWTIGYGFNLQDSSAPGILRRVSTKSVSALIHKTEFLTEEEAQGLLLIHEELSIKASRSFFPNFNTLDLARQVVVAAMVYQFGAARFGKFRRLIPAIQRHDWPAAVESMRQSKWYRSDSPKRARRMAEAMRTGNFPPGAHPSAPGMRARPVAPPPPTPVEEPKPVEAPKPPRRSSWPFED